MFYLLLENSVGNSRLFTFKETCPKTACVSFHSKMSVGYFVLKLQRYLLTTPETYYIVTQLDVVGRRRQEPADI